MEFTCQRLRTWTLLDDADKDEVKRTFDKLRVEEQQQRLAPIEKLPSSATPHGLGNHEWAIAPDKITHLCNGEKLSKVADAWHNEYGHRIAIGPNRRGGRERNACAEVHLC